MPASSSHSDPLDSSTLPPSVSTARLSSLHRRATELFSQEAAALRSRAREVGGKGEGGGVTCSPEYSALLRVSGGKSVASGMKSVEEAETDGTSLTIVCVVQGGAGNSQREESASRG